ncbi:IclR family transcriptional regulator [Aestuariicella hydrocarbonica]|uniref:IclR family transcriptional regulator n=1 Tax=Pseudomaricurvus hydrocarbonicus TaxID=1470433 RepID=A0A9E5JWU0_9GAMM|nr:IclR family transcriptional regulator [Aestuariicella hydrocarbonica]NHO66011.1 IclR family transcriptional regulator [Aestuariicella hydrocarbonica]
MNVKQITNLFSLMEFFVRAQRPLAVKDMVAEFGWPRSSVFNTVSTLVDLGYLYQPVARGGYYPTTKWMELARQLSEAQPLPESLHQLLEELASKTGETLFLAAPEGTSIVFLDVVESLADIRFIANIGQRLPIHVTAAGRAILSQYAPAERAATLRRIQYQPYERDDFMTPEAVEDNIQQGLSQGWFVNPGIYAPGVAGVAVAFPFQGQRYAIALGGPASRLEKNMASLGELLQTSVDQFLHDNES